MKLRFTINYRTEWGQQLVVALRYHNVDGTGSSVLVPMQTTDGEHWTADTAVVESRRSPISAFTYYYIVADNDGRELRREWNMVARTFAFDASKSYVMHDLWRDTPLPQHLYTNAFAVTRGFATNESTRPLRLPLFRKTIVFRVSAPQLLEGQQLAVVGNHPALGSWSPARYLPMEYAGQKEWMLSLNADGLQLPLEYKFVVVDGSTHQLLLWEEGENRMVMHTTDDGEVQVLCGDGLRISEKPWRIAGVSIPVFSLRSEQSYGVGDFGDLYRFVDWAVETGMRVIQLLPVNDTTCTHSWNDSHPYNIVSAFALHPHYLDLEQAGELDDEKLMARFHRQRNELNAMAYSDYEAVDRVKSEYITLLFKQKGSETLACDEYQQWHRKNREWLEPYAEWLTRQAPNKEQARKQIAFTQYLLHCQLLRAANYARSKGILLKGDLPISVNAQSAETWQHPQLFFHDTQAGTPPINDKEQGQNWGFPIYKWGKECEQWFARRMRWMEQYFDSLRIDHVLGFFRIWEIPSCQHSAVLGHFVPSLPLSVAEIEQAELPFRRDFLTKPFINDRIVERIFGYHAQYVRENFLISKPYGLYDLAPSVATEKQVWALFDGKTDENSLWIRDGLCRLIANVLFVEDPRQPNTYHPRIAAYKEPVFKALGSDEREAYMHLYNNYFGQRHEALWGATGYQRLSKLIHDTRMLICAEDLGHQSSCVAGVLDALRMLTLEVQRMPKQDGFEFAHIDAYPVRSVATTSTHDMPTLRLWWQEWPERTQRYYTTMLQKQGQAPEQLSTTLAEEIVARHLYAPSMVCILPLQDWLALDGELREKSPRQERINTPGDAFNHWQYRMHVSIDALMAAKRLNEKLKTMISRSKR